MLARLAGDKLNTALVKAFVNAITFFPIGCVVRTSREEIGVVVETNSASPLHPVVALVDSTFGGATDRIDTSVRDSAGVYLRHIVETMPAPERFDVRLFFDKAA